MSSIPRPLLLLLLLQLATPTHHHHHHHRPPHTTTPLVVLPAHPNSTSVTLAKPGLHIARPLHVRLRRAGRHCNCLEKQPSARTQHTPSHGFACARVAHGRRGCRLPMQGLRRGMHLHRRIVHRARVLTRPVAQILEEGKAFELGMSLKCPPGHTNAFL